MPSLNLMALVFLPFFYLFLNLFKDLKRRNFSSLSKKNNLREKKDGIIATKLTIHIHFYFDWIYFDF